MKRYFLICLFLALGTLEANDTPQQNVLTVTGQGKATVKADQADIHLGIQLEKKTAREAQESLAEKLKPVLDALKELKPAKLETGSIQINPNYDTSNPPRLIGYKGSITVLASVEAARAGAIIDTAFSAGANQLASISLRPTDDSSNEARVKALQMACQNAIREADAVMKALGLEKREIVQVIVDQGFVPTPLYKSFAGANAFVQTSAAVPTEITEQEQTISASVQVNIGI